MGRKNFSALKITAKVVQGWIQDSSVGFVPEAPDGRMCGMPSKIWTAGLGGLVESGQIRGGLQMF